jgi:DNA-binding HxlR family transcriptional regulator
MSFDLNEWKPLEDIITNALPAIRGIIAGHLHAIDHDADRKSAELRWFLEKIRFFTRKWNVDILYELNMHGGLIFNELKRHLGGVSSRTVSDCLKELQKNGLVSRQIQDTQPPSVLYSLTEKGKGFVEISMILIYYLAVK